MRSKVFWAISLLACILPVSAAACGFCGFLPEDYYMYRISGNYMKGHFDKPSFNYMGNENCLLWKEQTGTGATLDEIYEVVYKTSYQEIEYFTSPKADLMKSKVYMKNEFARTLRNDTEAAQMLMVAKYCESARKGINSPWYYPAYRDPVVYKLEEVIKYAKAYTGDRFKTRYALQVERALLSLQRYDECISYWDKVADSLPDDIIKDMALRYVAGAWYNKGDIEKARTLFGQAGDIESLTSLCRDDERSIYEIIYDYAPDSEELRDMVERNIIAAEHQYFDNSYEEHPNWMVKDLQNIHKAALRIASEGKVKDVDLWYYTAAFIEHLGGDNKAALKTVALAEKAPGSQFIKESAKVLRIYVTAVDTPYSSKYLSKTMMSEIKWLDEMVQSNLEEAREETSSNGIFYMKSNMSYYYWNDMLRKVLLGVVCPKLLKGGDTVNALALTNMADNRLLSLVDCVHQYEYNSEDWSLSIIKKTMEQFRGGEGFNYNDYSNAFFKLADTVSVDALVKYVSTFDKPKKDQKYINARSYTDKAYFADIVGTRMLREGRYAEAEKWLSQVPSSFQKRLNVDKEGYLKLDPFTLRIKELPSSADYKISFAREMASLERNIKKEKDPDMKAMMIERFATGMKNSVDKSWALTFYGRSWYDEEPLFNSYQYRKRTEVLEKVQSLYGQALATARGNEAKATILRDLGNLKTAVTEYPETQVAAFIRSHCDVLADYHMERPASYRLTWND